MVAIKEKVIELPEAEHPYQLPDGWKWSTLGSYFSTVKDKIDPISENEMNYIGLEHIEKNGGIIDIGSADGLKSTKTLFKKGDVLYGKLRPYLNKHVCAPFDGMCSTDILAFRSNGEYLPELLNTYLNLTSVIRYANENSKGINLPRVSAKIMEQLPLPVPPLETQRQIVAKLESMLVKIHEARELISEAKESFQNRRAAILAKAFRGELTAKWREQNPDVENSKVTLPLLKNDIPFNIPKSWKWTSIESIAKSFQNGLSKRNSEQGIDTVVLRLADIKENQIIQENQREIKLSEKEINKYTLNKNDLLIIRVNGSKDIVGQPIIMNSDQKYAFCDHLIRMSVDESLISPEFCFYYFQSTFVRKYIEQNMVSSAGQNTINQTAIKNIPVPLPTIAEQKLILDLLKDFLDSESESFDLIETNKTFNHLEKSLLSQAFRGDLTSNLSQGVPTN